MTRSRKVPGTLCALKQQLISFNQKWLCQWFKQATLNLLQTEKPHYIIFSSFNKND